MYNVSDTYVGSCESTKINAYVFDNNTNKLINKEISYVPGLLKIFDEVIVNAIDHATRLKMEEKNGKENIKHGVTQVEPFSCEFGWFHGQGQSIPVIDINTSQRAGVRRCYAIRNLPINCSSCANLPPSPATLAELRFASARDCSGNQY